MTRVFCYPKDHIPSQREFGVEYVSMYEHEAAGRQYGERRSSRTSLLRAVYRARVADFLTLALAVNAADNVLERATSADG